jgi:hypothetical protein
MPTACDICSQFRPAANERDRMVTTMIFEGHLVLICQAHRRIAEANGVRTFEDLRELYGESDGRRSYVPRRDHAGGRAGGRRVTDR